MTTPLIVQSARKFLTLLALLILIGCSGGSDGDGNSGSGSSDENTIVAAFSADSTSVTEGGTVNYTDLSSNSPTSWSWIFEGGTPSSSTSKNPSVTYNTAGTYTVSLTASNDDGNDTETKTNYINVIDDSGGQTEVSSCSDESTRIRNLPVTGKVINVAPASSSDQVVVDGNTTTLRQVIIDADSGDLILLANGIYTFTESNGSNYTGLYFTKPNLTMRSASGDPNSVIIDSEYKDLGPSASTIVVSASDIILANFTVKRSIYHLIHFSGAGDDSIVHNVKMEDGGQQFMKASIGGDNTIDGVQVSCSEFIMTETGRDNIWGYTNQDGSVVPCYTGGIDTHKSSNWQIHDNFYEGIYCNADGVLRPAHGKKTTPNYTGGLAEHAIHMWDSPQGTSHFIERNRIKNCARGIGIGFNVDVYGTWIVNNMIFSEHAGGSEHDIGISVMRAHDIRVLNNTVFYSSPSAYGDAIEYRYAVTTDTEIRNNLTNQDIQARNGAEAGTVLSNNVDNAQADWFVDPVNGDLHLTNCNISEVAGQALTITGLDDDIDGDQRNGTSDIGADQCQP